MVKASKRIISLYMLMTLLFMAILVRIVYINRSSYEEVANQQSKRTVVIGTTRGKIYDRNRELLVDTQKKLVAAVTPVASAEKYLQGVFSSESFRSKIKNGYPFVATVQREIDSELVKTFEVPVRYSVNSLASHIVGYVDASGKGVTGIEKAFDKELSSFNGRLTVNFDVDALGRVLAGMDKTVVNENFNSSAGVLLTLEKRIQKLTEDAIKQSDIESGCAIVMHIDSGDIVALSSVPDFDRNNVENSLEAENSPLMNKALSAYSAGSVFKSIVAAFALREGISEKFSCDCEGSIKIGDKQFNCYSSTAHGKQNMAEALQNSCNIYFIKLIEKLDTEKLLSFCKELGFGESISLCSSIVSDEGKLPDKESLNVKGNLANFSFGQGDLLVTPLQILKAYHALATGFVVEPRLVHGFCDGKGNITYEKEQNGKRVISNETTLKIRQMLYEVTEKGIATNARSSLMKLAGKTGTAETGIIYENGEVYRTWFAGFYPAENPHYIVVVMNENGTGGNTDCAPVFKNICEWIAFESPYE